MVSLRPLALSFLVVVGLVAACGGDSPPPPKENPDGSASLVCSDAGTTACGDVCVATASDPAHCGGCNKACATGELCTQGVCSAACSTSETRCGSACVNTTSDSANCGGCGVACSTGQSCVSGSCAVVCVIGGQRIAAGTVNSANACEQCQPTMSATAWTSRADGTQCGSGQVCSVGACASGCFIGNTFFVAGTPNPANACEACAPATSTTAWTARSGIPLLVGGSDVVAQGWTTIAQSPSSLTYGTDYVRLETSTPSNSRSGGQLLLVRSKAFDPARPYAIRVTMQVESVNKHNSLDSAAAILVGFTPTVGNPTERSQMVYLDSSAIGWADDTQAAAFPVTDGLFHVYELSVDAAKVATVSVDGIAKLTRNNFTANGTLAIGDQTNDGGFDAATRVKSVELRCQ
ncbi:hypothetical protein JGU66_27390 [Myxococcaceae bacterium JPH2]|nr:hypothetical protein [Myxococcaceae bacterium JPH2]